jgi:phage/plasmid primase-like uncharacterized protein
MSTIKSQADFLHTVLATLGHAPMHVEPGKFHRFGPGKAGWAKVFDDGMGAVYGDYRLGISSHWSARENQTPADLAAMRHQINLAAAEREREQQAQWTKNAEANARLWAESAPAGEAVRSYLIARGLEGWIVPACIREHPGLTYWDTDSDGVLSSLGKFTVMLAPIVRNGKLLAIHRTYLLDGKKAPVPTVKKLTAAAGLLNGACIPLAAPRAGVLGIAEGLETAVAASLGSGSPVVAAYCANALAGFMWPSSLERLIVFADNDDAGQKAAASLARRAKNIGLDCKVLTPSKPGADWADVWVEGRA